MRTVIIASFAGVALAACASSSPTEATASTSMLSSAQKAQVDETFMQYDFNADGIITAYEEKEFLKSEFTKADADNDGVTDDAAALSRDAFFADGKLGGDANGDGKITRAEYETYFAAMQ